MPDSRQAEFRSGHTLTGWFHLIAVAVLLTGLNAFKPIHGDDPVYLQYAAEFIAHPLQPYAFEYGSPRITQANHLLVPPVVCYWLGAGTWILGDHPVLLKWWLFPFALMMVAAVSRLAGRFAANHRLALVWLIGLSPSVLPAFNCMLDVPEMSLGLAALAVTLQAVDKKMLSLTLLAGLLAALAIQTKYTGLVMVAVILVWSILQGQPLRGLAIAVLAVALAVGWEFWIAIQHGQSHFLIHLQQRNGAFFNRCLHLILPLLTHLGGLGIAPALLGLLAIGCSRGRVWTLALISMACFGLLTLVPSQLPLITGSQGKPLLTPSNLIYGILALIVCSSLVACSHHLIRHRQDLGQEPMLGLFLLLWLLLELGGYFALSPFPAARRLNGMLIVFALIAGRLASLGAVSWKPVAFVTCYGVLIAMLIFLADLQDTRSGQGAAPVVARGRIQPDPGHTFWYLSWMGFGYYAEREGLVPLQVNRQTPRAGDLIAVDHLTGVDCIKAPALRLQLVDTLVVKDNFPLRATPGYSSGRTPLEHRSGPRMEILIYRVQDAQATP